jgi:hypothetical protein
VARIYRAAALVLGGGLSAFLLVGPAALSAFLRGPAGDVHRNTSTSQVKPVVIVVPGNAAWTDTGLDVASGEAISFEAEGTISLQKGNPEAECGPAGYDLLTIRQPVPGRNLGALIGKVVIAVTVTVDEKTKQEKRDEVAELFYVGPKNLVEMPAKGRLFLGINETVIGDNAGEFRVTVSAPPDSPGD